MKQNHKIWWDRVGSAMRPNVDEDLETFAKRITEYAWDNGAVSEPVKKPMREYITEFEKWWEEEGKYLLPSHYQDGFDLVKRLCGRAWLMAVERKPEDENNQSTEKES